MCRESFQLSLKSLFAREFTRMWIYYPTHHFLTPYHTPRLSPPILGDTHWQPYFMIIQPCMPCVHLTISYPYPLYPLFTNLLHPIHWFHAYILLCWSHPSLHTYQAHFYHSTSTHPTNPYPCFSHHLPHAPYNSIFRHSSHSYPPQIPNLSIFFPTHHLFSLFISLNPLTSPPFTLTISTTNCPFRSHT